MVYEFYPWKVDVNKAETIKYYQTEDMSADKKINNIVYDKMSKRQKEFFENLGVDISKILVQNKLACFELRFYISGNVVGLPKSQKEGLESVFPIICPNDVELYATDNFLCDIDGMVFRFKHPCSYFLDETYNKWNCGFFYGMALISNDESSFAISEEFHEKYYDDMYYYNNEMQVTEWMNSYYATIEIIKNIQNGNVKAILEDAKSKEHQSIETCKKYFRKHFDEST